MPNERKYVKNRNRSLDIVALKVDGPLSGNKNFGLWLFRQSKPRYTNKPINARISSTDVTLIKLCLAVKLKFLPYKRERALVIFKLVYMNSLSRYSGVMAFFALSRTPNRWFYTVLTAKSSSDDRQAYLGSFFWLTAVPMGYNSIHLQLYQSNAQCGIL